MYAIQCNVPVLCIGIMGQTLDVQETKRYIRHLETEMALVNPSGLALLREQTDGDLSLLKLCALGVLEAFLDSKCRPEFRPQLGDEALIADLKDIVQGMAKLTDRTIVWTDPGAEEQQMQLGTLWHWLPFSSCFWRETEAVAILAYVRDDCAAEAAVLRSAISKRTDRHVVELARGTAKRKLSSGVDGEPRRASLAGRLLRHLSSFSLDRESKRVDSLIVILTRHVLLEPVILNKVKPTAILNSEALLIPFPFPAFFLALFAFLRLL
eukprot:4182647-Pleurochrysis_carterae.AAC.1